MEKASKIIDWYWNDNGHERKGEYQLALGDWLDKLYSLSDRFHRISGGLQYPKATLAIWGTSQTGKSTLLTTYIDAGSDDRGGNSALEWGNQPARFGTPKEKDETIVTFNPHNEGHDGSGCVTRFVLAESDSPLVNAQYPVQVRLFSRRELMHALAAGYLSECDLAVARDEHISWSLSLLQEEMNTFRHKAGAKPDRVAFEWLHDLVEIVTLLAELENNRYRNLTGAKLAKARQAILECPALNSDRDNAKRFVQAVLWDSMSTLNKTLDDLIDYLYKLHGMLPEQASRQDIRVLCSVRVAALLVNFGAYPNFLSGDPWTNKLVRSLKCRPIGQTGLLITDDPGVTGTLLFGPEQERDFALLQAVVRELVVPLRSDVVQRNSPVLYELLQKADLVDFPGTSKQDRGHKDVLWTEDSLQTSEGQVAVFTRILKRGRTASIVQSSVQNNDIDGFSMLCRWGHQINKPDQLYSGIDLWWRSMTGAPLKSATGKDLPLNLVMTFMGGLVRNMLVANVPNIGGLLSDFLQVLPRVTDPSIATCLTVAYPQWTSEFPGVGVNNQPASSTQLDTVYRTLSADSEFKRRFVQGGVLLGETENHTLREMMTLDRHSGKDYLFKKLAQDASSSKRRDRLRERLADLSKDWTALLAKALPDTTTNDQQRKRQCIQACCSGVQTSLDSFQNGHAEHDASRVIGHQWRVFMDVFWEVLLPIPERVALKRVFSYEKFLEAQLEAWKNSIPASVDLELMGLPDKETALRLRSYLAEAVLLGHAKEFAGWLKNELGNINNKADCSSKRKFLAAWLSARLSGRHLLSPHPPMGEDMVQALFQLARLRSIQTDHFQYTQSFHWQSFLKPFLDHLANISDIVTGGRGDQPGDIALLALIQ